MPPPTRCALLRGGDDGGEPMREDRRHARVVIALPGLLVLGGCLLSGCTAHAAGTVRASSTSGPPTTVLSAADASRSAALPAELGGRWVGDDPRHVGSWTIEIGADGSYRESNPRRGVAVHGRAAVAGNRLYLQPDGADSRAVTWEISDGTLLLDGSATTYRRA